jgi:hypothetical protein
MRRRERVGGREMRRIWGKRKIPTTIASCAKFILPNITQTDPNFQRYP